MIKHRRPWAPESRPTSQRLRYQAATDQRNNRARRTEFHALRPRPRNRQRTARRKKAEIVLFAHL